MTDRPILFSGAMVQALLAGRKTQTRRMLKPQPQEDIGLWMAERDLPYAVGDRLWCRETFIKTPGGIAYAADGTTHYGSHGQLPRKPGIHMFRCHSRLTLTVTEVRVQRLQEISDADVLAEGIFQWPLGFGFYDDGDVQRARTFQKAVFAYRYLWDSINGARPGCAWAENPFVIAVSFSVERRNIDA